MGAVKIALVYTVTGTELEGAVERAVHDELGAVELLRYSDPSILEEAAAAGRVTRNGAARLVEMYMAAVHDGADAILNCCSTVGEVAEGAQGLAACLGVPIVRIDAAMCREAVRVAVAAVDAAGGRAARVGVLATAATTLEPTGNMLRRAAREQGRPLEVVDGLVRGASGLAQDEYRAALLARARELEPQVDALVLAQGSMAFCEDALAGVLDVPVLSSPRLGAAELARVLGL